MATCRLPPGAWSLRPCCAHQSQLQKHHAASPVTEVSIATAAPALHLQLHFRTLALNRESAQQLAHPQRQPHTSAAVAAAHGHRSSSSSWLPPPIQQEQQQRPLGMSSHTYARTDDEEQLALELALAASLADAHGQAPPPRSSESAPTVAAPAAPASRRSPPPSHVPSHAGGSAGPAPAASGVGQRWRSPLRLLEGALSKVADKAAEASGGARCAGCGGWLGVGAAVRALGQQWHPQCFRCAGCQQPLALSGHGCSFAVGADQLPYHDSCHKQLLHPRCSVCAQHIPARGDGRIEWREDTFWREKHCPSHSHDGTPRCCSCSRLAPLVQEWVGLQDGRVLCLECLDSMVCDTKEAQPLYEEVLTFFEHMGLPHAYKAPLLLVEGPVLEQYASQEGRPQGPPGAAPVFHVRGLCVAHVYTTIPSVVRARGGQQAVSSVNTLLAALQPQAQAQHCSVSVLLVMYGLPRVLCGSIMAHELMHAYLRMRHVTGLPLQVEEGLCQLMAQLWLDSQDHWAKRAGPYQERLLSYCSHQIRTDTSEVYGEGFRIALEQFQQRGLRALVEHVIAHGAWPAWQL